MDTLQKILRIDDADKDRLDQSGIKSVKDFIDYDSRQLSKVLDTTIEQIKEMKILLQKVYKVEAKQGFQLLQEIYQNCEKFLTQIPQIDEILPGNGTYSGDIIEITGPTSACKTSLLYTFMMNILDTHEDINILFIDTKCDFSAVKLKKFLTSREVDELKQVQMMKRIQVERTRDCEDLIKALQYIYDTPLQHEMLKFIMIDSITVLFYMNIGHTVFQLSHLTQASELMRLLGKQNKAIIVTNLANHHRDVEAFSSQRSSKSYSSLEGSEKSVRVSIKPATGQYWESIAHHKILIDFLDFPHNFGDYSGERNVSLFASKTAGPSSTKSVKITNCGIV